MKFLKKHIDDVLLIACGLLVSVGTALIYVPAGLIVLGICCGGMGYLLSKSTVIEKGGEEI